MKKLLCTTAILSLYFFFPSALFAQSTGSPLSRDICSPYVQASNYGSCCSGAARSQHLYSCTSYDDAHKTAPGMIGNPDFGTTGALGTNPVNTTSPSSATVASSPQAGSAQLAQCSSIRFLSLLDILIWVKCIIVVAIIPLIFAAALMFFLWGVMKFIAASSPEKKKEGKKFIVAGMIGLFVMTSLWGIIKIAANTLGTGSAVPLLQTKDYLAK